MIEIRSLNKSFGQHQVLKDIDVTMYPGQSAALIGPNGSGKTTLIKAILGLVRANRGKILFDGKDIRRDHAYRSRIGYMPQLSRFPDNMTVSQLFMLMKNLRSDIPAEEYDVALYNDFSLEKLKKKKLGNLSGGMRQHVSAALAFYFNPDVLILDEPTAALDPMSNEMLKAHIRKSVKSGKLVITTSHILSDLEEIINHVFYLMEGRLRFSGSLDELRRQTSEDKLNKMIISLLGTDEIN